MSEDRRREERKPIRLKVAYRTAQSLVTEYTSSVSKGGCRLVAHRPLEVGTSFVFEMYIRPGLPPVEVLGEVIWCNRLGDAEHEIGVRYAQPEGDRGALDQVLDRLFSDERYDKARAHPRVTVRLTVADARDPERHYLLRDLSRGGLGLQMPVTHDLYADLVPGARLLLSVALAEGARAELPATVVWCARATPTARAAAGAAFAELGAAQVSALERLMRLHRPSEMTLRVLP